jgi:hypothetical protein
MSRQHAVLIVGDPIRKKTGLVEYAEKKYRKKKQENVEKKNAERENSEIKNIELGKRRQ